MANYRKKPVEVQAWPVEEIVRAATTKWSDLPPEVAQGYEQGVFVFTDRGIHVQTLEGVMLANMNDMLIMGVHGEFYGCKPEIFDKTYEEVREEPAKTEFSDWAQQAWDWYDELGPNS